MVHEVLEGTYHLLNELQSTCGSLAASKPSPEYTKAVSRNRRWVTKAKEAALQPPDTPWTFVGKTMPSFTIAEPHDQPSSCPFRPGHTLSSLPGQSVSLTSTTFHYPVRDSSRSGTMYTLPRSSKTQLSCEIDAYPGAQEMSHLHQLNEYCQKAAAQACEATICAMPNLLRDSPGAEQLAPLTWVPQRCSHRCDCINPGSVGCLSQG